MAARMPSPIAVRRPVVRLATAPRRACLSFVGAWTICANVLNATMPICVVALCCSMNEAAAAFAASSRSGAMSFEHMLPDTSMVSTIVVWLAGTLAMAIGRASATTSAAIATANSANGRWRRSRPDPGCASRTSERLE